MTDQDQEFPAQWALDLLRGPTIYKEAFYIKYLAEITCTISGAGTMLVTNFIMHKPLYSALPWHFFWTAVGFAIGRTATIFADYKFAKRDAMIVDYIKLHPERFPPPRNKKLAEIIEPWFPIR
nr:PREDICTED: NADH dehydrogenase [ubiquinone] 1 subunit C2 [Megachile rotundata]XP_012140675.1 PREDICTED: NADH dehydrogenase [ubiquinone] 1 subunit C2 [Megachile rotundata]XP_012140676.1 PREDICTED: NADH dehydrogenase [ubiquinone] 1 subunit C2 [Megachile rotundata]